MQLIVLMDMGVVVVSSIAGTGVVLCSVSK